MDYQNCGLYSPFNRESHVPLENSRQKAEQQNNTGIVLPSFPQLNLNESKNPSPLPNHSDYLLPPLKRTSISIPDLVNNNMQQHFESVDQEMTEESSSSEDCYHTPRCSVACHDGSNDNLQLPRLSELNYGHPDLYSTIPTNWQHQESSLDGAHSLLIGEHANPLSAPTALKIPDLSDWPKKDINFVTDQNGTGDWIGYISNQGTTPANNTPEVAFIVSSNHHPNDRRMSWSPGDDVHANFGVDFDKSHARWDTDHAAHSSGQGSRDPNAALPSHGGVWGTGPAVNLMQARQRGLSLPAPGFENSNWGWVPTLRSRAAVWANNSVFYTE